MFHFGLDKGIHLMKVACSPHQPHGDPGHNESNQTNPKWWIGYFWFSLCLPSGDWAATCLSTTQPTMMPTISQTMVPIRTGCILLQQKYNIKLILRHKFCYLNPWKIRPRPTNSIYQSRSESRSISPSANSSTTPTRTTCTRATSTGLPSKLRTYCWISALSVLSMAYASRKA